MGKKTETIDLAIRADELAENESLEILSSALYSALEADLSGHGWPFNSKELLEKVFGEDMDTLIRWADNPEKYLVRYGK